MSKDSLPSPTPDDQSEYYGGTWHIIDNSSAEIVSSGDYATLSAQINGMRRGNDPAKWSLVHEEDLESKVKEIERQNTSVEDD